MLLLPLFFKTFFMASMRNKSCPCGSGKKYKHCCLIRDQVSNDDVYGDDTLNIFDSELERPQNVKSIAEEIADVMAAQKFESIEEANQFLSTFNAMRNQRGIDDFMGLSPEQMHHFLNMPFDSPQFITINDVPLPQAPIMQLLDLLIMGLGDEGGKATAKGNLPRALCQQIKAAYTVKEEYMRGSVSTELDFESLHTTRLIAELAKLIRKYKGRFVVTRKGKALMHATRRGELFRLLLETYVTQFNWAYRDGYPEVQIIQQSFMFTLYMISICGEHFRETAFYEERFLVAFPMVLDMIMEDDILYGEPDRQARHCYEIRALVHFAQFFGLIDVDIEGKGFDRVKKIRKVPRFDDLIEFKLGTDTVFDFKL